MRITLKANMLFVIALNCNTVMRYMHITSAIDIER